MKGTIKVSIGRTYNVGNYQSVRLDVGMEKETHMEITDSDFEDLYNTLSGVLTDMELGEGVEWSPKRGG